jgi:protein-S-isoprenylcysteine O-methyltransferase Ste14
MLERAGRALFRWRSFTPLLLAAVALPLLWTRGGPASAAWTAAGLLLCIAGQTLRAWVLGQVPDGTSGQNEKLIATSLNTTGPYALTRNPLYLGNLAITLGLCLIAHDALLLVVVALLFALQYRAIIAAEEGFLRERFGAAYDAWCARVPRFWPRLAKPDKGPPWDVRRALRTRPAWVGPPRAPAAVRRRSRRGPRPVACGEGVEAPLVARQLRRGSAQEGARVRTMRGQPQRNRLARD